MVVGGATLVLGWLVVPLLFDGVDRTLDPLKLARFPLRTRTLMTAMFLVGITWVPGIATLVVSVGIAIAWRAYPAAAAAAVVAGLIGAATCVAGSQLTTTVVGTLLRGRGAARVAIAALGALALAVPLAIATLGGATAASGGSVSGLIAAMDVLGWSPLGRGLVGAGAPRDGRPGGRRGGRPRSRSARSPASSRCGGWRSAPACACAATVRRARSPAAASGRSAGCPPRPPERSPPARSSTGSAMRRQARQLLLLPVLPALLLIWWRPVRPRRDRPGDRPDRRRRSCRSSAFAGLSYDGTAFAAELARRRARLARPARPRHRAARHRRARHPSSCRSPSP